MAMDKRERQRREAAEEASEIAARSAARTGVVMRNVTTNNNGGHGIRFGAGVKADMEDVRAEGNKGDGFHFE